MLSLEEMCSQAAQWGMPAVALTDYGNLHGAFEFYHTAKKHTIEPIIGLDITLVDGNARERTQKYTQYNVVLLAQSNEGLQNLFKLGSLAHVEGFYYKPRIDWSDLEKFGKGLIALTGNRFGLIGKHVQEERIDVAQSKLEQLAHVMGRDQIYLEVIDTGLPIQKKINQATFELSEALSLPYVASNDCHYLAQEDHRAFDVMLCIGSGKFIHEENRLRFPSDQYYFRDPSEMQRIFEDHPQALSNTLEIAERCKIDLKREGYCMPTYETQAGASLEDELERVSAQGLDVRLDQLFKRENIKQDGRVTRAKPYHERLKEELSIINSMGFAGYFLIVADFINYAKDNGIPVGPGRGSAAGSLVAYALKITDIDPLPYDLLFERFLNPERISMPDIDIDFCQEGRDQVLAYVSQKYDEEGISGARVAQICTFGKMQARAAIRDVGRVLGITYGEVDKVAKLVPNVLNISLEQAFEQEPKFEEMRNKDREIDELLLLAKRIEGLPRHASVHAAGVVISDANPLWHHLPLMRGQNNEVVTQWDMKAAEKIGLVKFDFLGLKTLTLLARALTFIQASQKTEIDLLNIPMDDAHVFELLSRGETQGIFQLESSGMRDLIKRLKPNAFEDIIALVALFRPGPLGSGMVDDFINRKHGRTQIAYDLPELEPILQSTYGVILYQEQVMSIASTLANYTLGDADLLRRAMGKKIKSEMDQQEQKFLEGASKNKYPKDKAKKIFDLMAKFAGYGFNKSHSAAYALISYQTAFLKAHYPVEFMAACFSIDRNNTDRIVSHLSDCRASNIEVLPPHINLSASDFTVENKCIRFGLSGIKNVGSTAIASIIETRDQDGPFDTMFELCQRVTLRQVNKKVLEALVKSGAMDVLGEHRAQLMIDMEPAVELGSMSQKDQSAGQDSLFSQTWTPPKSEQEVPKWDDTTLLQFEKESVGFYISGHPLSKAQDVLKLYTNTSVGQLDGKVSKTPVRLGGLIIQSKEITTKKGKRMAFAQLEDLTGAVELVIFPQAFEDAREHLRSEQPLFVLGKVDAQEEQGQVKILVDGLCPLEDAALLFDGQVHIELNAQTLENHTLEKLKMFIAQHKGPSQVYLHFNIPGQSKTTLPLGLMYCIKPTLEVIKQLKNTFSALVYLK